MEQPRLVDKNLMKLEEFPEDLQILLLDYLDCLEIEPTVQHLWNLNITVREIEIDRFPIVATGDANGERGEAYAMTCPLDQTHPIIIWGDFWIDGRHRVHKARTLGVRTIHAINLGEYFPDTPQIAENCCIGTLKTKTNPTMKIFSVTGYYNDQTPDEAFSVLMAEYDQVLPETSNELGYCDNDIYFYGVSEESLNAAIRDKQEFGDFIPISWVLDGETKAPEEPKKE